MFFNILKYKAAEEGGSYNDCIVRRNHENTVVRLGSTTLTLTQLILFKQFTELLLKIIPIC